MGTDADGETAAREIVHPQRCAEFFGEREGELGLQVAAPHRAVAGDDAEGVVSAQRMVEVRQAHDGRLADVEIHVVEDDAVIWVNPDTARVERPVLLERIARGKDAALHEVAVATGVVLEGISREEVGNDRHSPRRS